MTKIGFILPVYNEEKNIKLFYNAILEQIKKIGVDYELLYLNDDSRDNSLKYLLELKEKDNNIKILDMSRRFGYELSLKAGLDYIDGDYIVIMDTDLQDPPSVIPDLYNEICKGYEMVYAKRKKRNDGRIKNFLAWFYYRSINKLSEVSIPLDTGFFRIFSRKVLEEVKKLDEQSRFLKGLFSRVGFKQSYVEYERPPRSVGETHFTFMRSLTMSLDSLFAFSTIPLRIATFGGIFFSILGFVLAIYYIITKINNPEFYIFGIPTIVVMLSIIGGIILLVLGIIGEYIGRIYKETKDRPLYIVKQFYK